MKLVMYPNAHLEKRALAVGTVDQHVRKILAIMHKCMIESDGIGLAAPQIGFPMRMFVIDIRDGNPTSMVNPRVAIDTSSRLDKEIEGCLSIPGACGEVVRYDSVSVGYTDEFGIKKSEVFTGLLARAIQHENDHLDGILHIDRMSERERKKAIFQSWTSRQ
jgi:peptide deformylase